MRTMPERAEFARCSGRGGHKEEREREGAQSQAHAVRTAGLSWVTVPEQNMYQSTKHARARRACNAFSTDSTVSVAAAGVTVQVGAGGDAIRNRFTMLARNALLFTTDFSDGPAKFSIIATPVCNI